MNTCCNDTKWQFKQDVGKARGCAFTYGKCTHCDSHLIHLFMTATMHEGSYQVVSAEFVAEMLKLEGIALKSFMQNWHDSIESD